MGLEAERGTIESGEPGGAADVARHGNMPDDLPAVERPDPLVVPGAADSVSDDNEIDFDDEREEDQLLLDVVEAREAGVLLDDPERLDPDATD